ncbi:unnamed protein product, partial [Porites evermanni]
ANVKESIEVKIFDPDFQMSDKRMLGLLKKVDLESHGYKKEVTIKLVSESGSVKPLYEKSYLYYKEIACSKLREIEQELQTMLPGVFGMEMVTKINQEIKTKNLTKMKRCKAGLEVHFKEAEGCNVSKTSTRRRQKRSPCKWCIWC